MADEERRLIEAVLGGQAENVSQHMRSLGDKRGYHVLLGAFTVAVQRQFPDDYTPQQVTAYVADLRRRMAEGEKLKPMPTEAMVRASLDEPELRQGVTTGDAVAAFLAVTYAYAQDRRLGGLDRDEFVQEVLEAIS
jgi:hypothetical protein